MRTPNCHSDKLIPKFESSAPTIVSGFTADLVMSCDYSPFGVTLEGRGVEGSYRYRFQGQEMDNEIKGEGNSVNYKYRMHCLSRHFGNPRVGRFFAVDPLSADYPWNSPYAFSENCVINSVELEGLERFFAADGSFIGVINNGSTQIRIVSSKNVEKVALHIQHANYSISIKGKYIWTNTKKALDKSVGLAGTGKDPERWNSGQANRDNPHSIAPRKEYKADNSLGQRFKNNGPVALFGEDFTQWCNEHSWFGSHDGALQGGWGGNKDAELKYGLTMVSVIIAVGTGGASLIMSSSSWSTAWSIIGIANAADDVSGLASNDGLTLIQNMLGKEGGAAFKLAVSFGTSRASLEGFLNNLDDAEKATYNIISAINDQGQVIYGLFQIDSQTNEEK